MTFAWTRGKQSHVYTPTARDHHVLALAVANEGAPRESVAATLVQRFAWLWPTYRTVASLVEAYSQPVNPRWRSDGDLHLAHLAQLTGAAREDEIRRAHRRDRIASMRPGPVPRGIAARALSGQLALPGAVHFRAPRGVGPEAHADDAKRRKLVPIAVPEGYSRSVNWFYGVRGSDGFRVEPGADGEEPPTVPKARPRPAGEDGC